MTPHHADIAWWDLPPGIEVDDLRADLARVGVEEWLAVPGLTAKFWISDEVARRWGAVMLWHDRPERRLLPPNRALSTVGRAPDQRCGFRVEAAAVPPPSTPERPGAQP